MVTLTTPSGLMINDFEILVIKYGMDYLVTVSIGFSVSRGEGNRL